MQLDMKTLVGKLNPPCRKALEGAAQLCVQQTHFSVEAEHLLLKLLEQPKTDLAVGLKAHDVDVAALTAELQAAIETMRRGNTRTPALGPQIAELLQAAWVYSSGVLGQRATRSAAVLQAALDSEALAGPLIEACPAFADLPAEALRESWPAIIAKSPEEMPSATEAARADSTAAKESRKAAKTAKDAADDTADAGEEAAADPLEVLDLYTVSLTDQALIGAIDPIVGRDAEIRQVIDILMRRRQNNPILTGEAGVGKTAVVEGFAQRIADGDVPPPLKDVDVRLLDLALLQAGAAMKGEFEERLKNVVEAVKASAKPIVLFVDEAHTLIGAGGAAGQGDAANLLKPALARGELRTIAATTWAEYKRYIEKDPALARRFQTVPVDEPDAERAVAMVRGLAERLAQHHKVRILDEAIADAVRLSARYIAGRQLPDKAIGVLDTACARVAVAQAGEPAALEAARRRAERLETEIAILKRERVREADHKDRLAALEADRAEAETEREALAARWESEREIVEEMRTLLDKRLEDDAPPGEAYAELEEKLAGLQNEDPMVPARVDGAVVAQVIAGWTGIPVGRMMRDEVAGVLALEERLAARIVGQDHALGAVAKRIRTYRAGLDDPGKPVGVFLFVGPSGVGKTETALGLAELLFGGEDHLITVNMSEFQEAHTVSALKGAPPGYVGFGQGGVLTEAVRRSPYSVVLLDEVEKAHPDVMELFFQVFDKGMMEDGEGIAVDFKNTVIIMTSNLGDRIITETAFSGEDLTVEGLTAKVRPELLKAFKPAFLGRLSTVPYLPLGEDQIRGIVDLKLARIAERFAANNGAELVLADGVADAVAQRSTEVESGARSIDAILIHNLLPALSDAVLRRLADGEPFETATVTLGAGGAFAVELS